MTVQSLGYVVKRAAAFRVCPPSVIGYVRVFLRALSTEMGKKRGGSGEKVIFVGKKGKTLGEKMHHATGATECSSREAAAPADAPSTTISLRLALAWIILP